MVYGNRIPHTTRYIEEMEQPSKQVRNNAAKISR